MSSKIVTSKHITVNASHHITSHKYACIVDTIFYPRKNLMGENPRNLYYEDIFKIRTNIHHDHEYQTLPHMRVYTRETKYLYFHVGHVAATSTLTLSIVLVIEALSSSSRRS